MRMSSKSSLARPLSVLGFLAAAPAQATAAAPAAAPAAAAPSACGSSGSVTTNTGTLFDGATYEIQAPSGLERHAVPVQPRYVRPGSVIRPQDVGDPVTGGWLLSHGYALAGCPTPAPAGQSSRRYQIRSHPGRLRQHLRHADAHHRLGPLARRHHHRWADPALPGPVQRGDADVRRVSGGVATWNIALDAEFAFQQLIDPSVQVVNITNPGPTWGAEAAAATTAQQTPQGRAGSRWARRSATPRAGSRRCPPSPPRPIRRPGGEPVPLGYPGGLPVRVCLPRRARGPGGRQPVVEHRRQLLRDLPSRPTYSEVSALYQAAGLSLHKDLRTLNQRPADPGRPAAVPTWQEHHLQRDISIPVLTMHTTGDGLVVPENEQAYPASSTGRNGALLRQIFVDRAGHCAFTPAETITAVQVLLTAFDRPMERTRPGEP